MFAPDDAEIAEASRRVAVRQQEARARQCAARVRLTPDMLDSLVFGGEFVGMAGAVSQVRQLSPTEARDVLQALGELWSVAENMVFADRVIARMAADDVRGHDRHDGGLSQDDGLCRSDTVSPADFQGNAQRGGPLRLVRTNRRTEPTPGGGVTVEGDGHQAPSNAPRARENGDREAPAGEWP